LSENKLKVVDGSIIKPESGSVKTFIRQVYRVTSSIDL